MISIKGNQVAISSYRVNQINYVSPATFIIGNRKQGLREDRITLVTFPTFCGSGNSLVLLYWNKTSIILEWPWKWSTVYWSLFALTNICENTRRIKALKHLCSQQKWNKMTQRKGSYSGAKLVMSKWNFRAENDLDIAKHAFMVYLELPSHIINCYIKTS